MSHPNLGATRYPDWLGGSSCNFVRMCIIPAQRIKITLKFVKKIIDTDFGKKVFWPKKVSNFWQKKKISNF